ncbi:MAG: DNA-binding response regulator [Gammaproteobacteria bacterium]|jgi:two-component system response regulator TtrR|nr:DNA-binding response regulator [Gammaproteobacteria bacterium]
MSSIKPVLFLVEDDIAICQALTALFATIQLPVKTYHTAQALLADYDSVSQQSGCLLIDVRLPDMSGLDLQEKLHALNNPFPIILMTGYGDVPMAVRAMKAGAFHFVLKPFNNQELLELVQRALLAGSKSKAIKPDKQEREQLNQLTSREREVIEHLMKGKLNKQVAADLGVSISTVELHRAHAMAKLQTKTIAGLIKKYLLLTRL